MSSIVGGELLGYVHDVTAVHGSGRVKYVTCNLQTSENAMIKAICFSPEKNTARLTSAMEKKSPIKLNKYQYNEKFNNVVIDKKSTITIHPTALPFAMNESMQNCLVTIESLTTTMPQQLVRIKATVKKISGVKTIKIERGNLTKSTAILVDPTGSINAVFWEEWSNSIEVDKTYIFTNFRVKRDNVTNEVYVNTAKEGFQLEETTEFEEDLAEARPSVMEVATREVTISVIGVKMVSTYHACSSCGKKGELNGKFVVCCEAKCKMKQKATSESKQWYARLFVVDVTSKEKFFIMVFNQHIVKMFESIGKELLSDMTEEQVTDTLLEVENLGITYNISDKKLVHVNLK